MALALQERGLFSWPEWATLLGEEIRRAQAAGEVRAGVDIDDLVRMVQAVTLAAEECDDPEAAERLFGFVLDGVRAR